MSQKKEITIKKPSAMIQTNVKGLSLTQRKFINALVHVAQDSGDQKLYSISLSKLKNICNITTDSNHGIKAQIRSLRNKDIEYNILSKDKKNKWINTPIIGGVCIEEGSGVLQFEIPFFLREQILNPEIYAPLDIVLIAGFSCVYTIVLYEFLRDYLNSPAVPRLEIEELRSLMGVEDGKYQFFKDLKKRVLDRAVNEINDNTDLFCSYDLFKKGGNRYSDIQFHVKKQNKRLVIADHRAVPPAVQDALPTERRVDAILDILREYCSVPIDEDFLISNIKYSVKHAKSNFSHYLKKALHEDYARQEREEYQKRRELTHQKEMEKLKLLRSKENKEQLGETLFNSLSLEDHLKYTEDVRVDLKTLGISNQFITEELIKMKIVEKLLAEKRAEKHGIQAGLF